MTSAYRKSQLRFEVDGANAARDFLRSYGIPEASVETVWDAISLHTTPGIPTRAVKHRPDTTFGTVNDDVLAFKDKQFQRIDFCKVILGNAWPS